MQTLKKTVVDGWSETRPECHSAILEYWNHRDELSVEQGLIFRGQKIVVPKSMREEMLRQVLTGHLGVTKTLERAKDNIFWPGMSKQITEHVLQCSVCLTHSNARELLIPHEFPQRPCQINGTDIFTFEGQIYLLTTDYYSRFFETDYLPDMRSKTVIQKLKVHMSRNGICDVCISLSIQANNSQILLRNGALFTKHQSQMPLTLHGLGET